MIVAEEYLFQHGEHLASGELTDEIRSNADVLCGRVNAMLTNVGLVSRKLRSGLRPKAYNATFFHHDAGGNVVRGGAPESTHMTGEGVDVDDDDGEVDRRCTDEVLEKYGLYREHPDSTPGWAHFQTRAPHSGHRTFFP